MTVQSKSLSAFASQGVVKSNKKALVIAIDNYRESPLRGCINDANRISQILENKHYGFEVRLLIDETATRNNFRSDIHWLFEDASTSILYFAGHGWRKPVATYLVTYDYAEHDEGVDLQWLASAANRLARQDQTVLYVLDCCHSGDGSVRGASNAIDIGPAELAVISGAGRSLLAACKGAEVAHEYLYNSLTHGAFTHHLCCALEGAAADDSQRVTLNAVFDYVASSLKKEGRQTPVMRGDQEGLIVLATGVSKIGSWVPIKKQNMSLPEAISKADELLALTHNAMTIDKSFEHWQTVGFAAACRSFEPVINWFKRRVESQPEFLHDQNFKKRYESAQHFYGALCSVTPGVVMPTGTVGVRIGNGGFGTVWKIQDSSWNKTVCFKAYHAHDLLDNEKVSRFRRGYEAMRQLDHPNIVKVLSLTEIPFGFFMDYIDGANVRALNPGASLEPDDIIALLLDVSETLKHAHGRGVIHRDVKPENILVKISDTGAYSAFLTDFDLAWFSAATQLTRMADGFGSHFYAAPEQINSPRAAIAHESTVDSYSFGQLCFFSICGRDQQAFDHESNIQALSDELSRKWNDSTASKEMLELFSRCTHRNPKSRIRDFREISERVAKLRATMEAGKNDSYDIAKFLEQVRFNLGGGIKGQHILTNSVSLRSRSGRTELTVMIAKDAPVTCAIDVALRPNEIILEGQNAASARLTINQRIDTMLTTFAGDHSATRKGAKSGAFEITVRIDHLSKDIAGVLKAREIISRSIDILEQA